MKYIVLTLSFVLSFVAANAQMDSSVTKFLKNKENVAKAEYTHWKGFEYGYNGFLTPNNSFDVQEEFLQLNSLKSCVFSYNFYEYKLKVLKNNFGILTGAGLEYTNYALANDYILAYGSGTSDCPTCSVINPETYGYQDSSIVFHKAKFKALYLKVPLLMELNFGKKSDKSAYFSAGVIGGFRLGTKYKIKYSEIGSSKKIKEKKRGNYNRRPFTAALTARFGFGSYGLYANYELTSLFKENAGPELYPFTIGLSMLMD